MTKLGDSHHGLLEDPEVLEQPRLVPIPISATPTAALNSTTAGTIALASAWNGLDGT